MTVDLLSVSLPQEGWSPKWYVLSFREKALKVDKSPQCCDKSPLSVDKSPSVIEKMEYFLLKVDEF